MNNLDIFTFLETIVDLGKLCQKFVKLGFEGYVYSDVIDFSMGIAMAWKFEKVTIS